MKRLAVLFLAIAIFITIKGITPCYAEDASTQVSQEPMQIEIGVSSVIPLVADELGVVASSSITISNNSYGPIVVTGITLNSQNDWAIVNKSDITSFTVGDKKYAISIDNRQVPPDGKLGLNTILNGRDSTTLSASTDLAPQIEAQDCIIATATVTVDYAEADALQPWLASAHAGEYVQLTDADFVDAGSAGKVILLKNTYADYLAYAERLKQKLTFENCTYLSSSAIYSKEEAQELYNTKVKKYTGSAEYVILPKNMKYLVQAFKDNANIKGIAFHPDAVTKDITSLAEGCTNLTEIVNLPVSITNASFAFKGCTNLTTSVLGENLQYMASMYEGSGVMNKLRLPSTTKIARNLYKNSGIAEPKYRLSELPEGIECFDALVVPEDLSQIATASPKYSKYTYEDLPVPSVINVPDTLGMQTSLAYRALSVPEFIKVCGNNLLPYALDDANDLQNLRNVELDVVAAGSQSLVAYSNAVSPVTSVKLGDRLRYIGDWFMQYFSNVTGELVLPESLEYIADGAFNHCSKYTNTKLVIPKNVKHIGGIITDIAPYDSETNRLTIKRTIPYGTHIFNDFATNTLEAFEVEEGNLNYKAIDGVLYSADGKCLIAYPSQKKDSYFEIPEGVTTIYELAFSQNTHLRKLKLPDSYVITMDSHGNELNTHGHELVIALYAYTKVEEIIVNETNPNYTTVDGVLYSKDLKTCVYIPNWFEGDLHLVEGMEYLGPGCCFWSDKSYYNAGTRCSNVYFPSTMKTVNGYAYSRMIMRQKAGLLTFHIADSNPYFKLDAAGELDYK